MGMGSHGMDGCGWRWGLTHPRRIPRFSYSYDGIHWTKDWDPVYLVLERVWGRMEWTDVGGGGGLGTNSHQPIVMMGYIGRATVTATSIFKTTGYGVAWNGRMWVAVGRYRRIPLIPPIVMMGYIGRDLKDSIKYIWDCWGMASHGMGRMWVAVGDNGRILSPIVMMG